MDQLQKDQVVWEKVPEKYLDSIHRLCTDPLSYAPDPEFLSHSSLRKVRVNVHFMYDEQGRHNFSKDSAQVYGIGLVWHCIKNLRKNKKMRLPLENETPVLPPLWEFELYPGKAEAINYHYDDDLFYMIPTGKNKNNYDRKVIQEYAIGLDSILNIFIMPNHPDSVRSKTYSVKSSGIALGNAIKITGLYEKKKGHWAYHGLTNHEIGHVFTLKHTWRGNDGCDDTPRHSGCWNKTDTPPCDTEFSNNVMDYNASQNAWSPCQIGKVRYAMANPKSRQRRLLVKTWCEKKEKKHIQILDKISWPCMKDLEGDITIHDQGELTINCRLSMPTGSRITVKPGGQLILNGCRIHNDCDSEWQGIFVEQIGKKSGKVIARGKVVIEDTSNSLAFDL